MRKPNGLSTPIGSRRSTSTPNERRWWSCAATTRRSISSGKRPVERPQCSGGAAGCDELVELADRVRSSRRGLLLAEVEHLADQLREMTQRRTLNCRRMSDANLEARRAAVL